MTPMFSPFGLGDGQSVFLFFLFVVLHWFRMF
jgi:hypothetical protein